MAVSPRQAADHYHKNHILTSSKLKGYTMLLERSLTYFSEYEAGNRGCIVKIQNILSQVQSSLNPQYEEAGQLFIAIAHLWDALETGDPQLISQCKPQLKSLHTLFLTLEPRR